MFKHQRNTTHSQSAFTTMTLIYDAAVRGARLSHRSPVIALFLSIVRLLVFMLVFHFFLSLFGNRTAPIRGDLILFLMSGVMLFVVHNNALKSTMNSEGPTAAMMQHAPMNTVIAVCASALSGLYMQILAAGTIMFLYHAAVTPIWVYKPIGAFGMFLVAWLSGISIGLMLKSLKPWFPKIVGIISSFYMRANMFTSGKMFLANTIPAYMWHVFSWNPLFHSIDQARGFTFINYIPLKTSIMYPIQLSLVFIAIGLIAEFYTQKHVSLSWYAKR